MTNCLTYFRFWIRDALRVRIEGLQLERAASQEGEDFGEGSGVVSTEHFVNAAGSKGSQRSLCLANRRRLRNPQRAHPTGRSTKRELLSRAGCWRVPVGEPDSCDTIHEFFFVTLTYVT